MAGKNGSASLDLIPELLEDGKSFSFFQTIRLLKRHCEKHWSDAEIKVKPDLSLAFPRCSAQKVERTETGFTVYANFLSLYGSASPLPAFFTEELFEDRHKERAEKRDFIDTLNRRFYELFFEACTKYKSLYQFMEMKDEKHIERLYSLIGLGEKTWRDSVKNPHYLLRYTGLLSQFSRSATGLEILLKDSFKVPLSVVSCLHRVAMIPEDQLCGLGTANATVGVDACIGRQVIDRNKFRIRVGPLDEQSFRRFIPGADEYQRLVSITRFYAKMPIEFDIESNLKAGEARRVCLGEKRWGAVGTDTWVFSGETMGMGTSVYSV